MECVIDTNALVYEMIEDSEHHAEAVSTFNKIEHRVIPSVVIEELVHVLKQLDVKEEIIRKKLEEILSDEGTEIAPVTAANIEGAANLIASHSVSFRRFNDKLVLSVARTGGLPLFTFDKDLLSQCRKENIKNP